MKKGIDSIHLFGYGDQRAQGICCIRVYPKNDDTIVVLCSALPEWPSIDLTVATQQYASDIWVREGRPATMIWIEYYASFTQRGYPDLFRLVFRAEGNHLNTPTREDRVRHGEVEQLIGESLAASAIDSIVAYLRMYGLVVEQKDTGSWLVELPPEGADGVVYADVSQRRLMALAKESWLEWLNTFEDNDLGAMIRQIWRKYLQARPAILDRTVVRYPIILTKQDYHYAIAAPDFSEFPPHYQATSVSAAIDLARSTLESALRRRYENGESPPRRTSYVDWVDIELPPAFDRPRMPLQMVHALLAQFKQAITITEQLTVTEEDAAGWIYPVLHNAMLAFYAALPPTMTVDDLLNFIDYLVIHCAGCGAQLPTEQWNFGERGRNYCSTCGSLMDVGPPPGRAA